MPACISLISQHTVWWVREHETRSNREFCLFVISSYSKLYTLKVYWALFNGIVHFITHISQHICYLPAGRYVWWKTVGSIFTPEVTVIHHTDRPLSRQIFLFFPAVNWFTDYKWVCLRNFVIESACAPSTTDLKKYSERASNSDTRQTKMCSRTDIFRSTLR